MSKPNPIIYLTSPVDQERLVRALYVMDILYLRDESLDANVTQWAREDKYDVAHYPWMCVERFNGHLGINGKREGGAENQIQRSVYTRVNSIEHMLTYLKAYHV